MKKRIMLVTLALALSGCATMSRPGGVLYRSGQEKKLARAVTLQKQGKTSGAAELLAKICAEPGVPGVTDEALFRLGLIRLGDQERNGVPQAQRDLERLKREYPASSWTPLAANIVEFLAATDEGRQQNKKLKELNLTLTKENKELHQSIEQLKSLELELGRGNKR